MDGCHYVIIREDRYQQYLHFLRQHFLKDEPLSAKVSSLDSWDTELEPLWLQQVPIGPRREKICLWRVANNTGADQPAHPRSLISAFAIRLLESIISRLATGNISIFKLVSIDEGTGLSLALLETPKTGFVATRPNPYQYYKLLYTSRMGDRG